MGCWRNPPELVKNSPLNNRINDNFKESERDGLLACTSMDGVMRTLVSLAAGDSGDGTADATVMRAAAVFCCLVFFSSFSWSLRVCISCTNRLCRFTSFCSRLVGCDGEEQEAGNAVGSHRIALLEETADISFNSISLLLVPLWPGGSRP